VPTDPARSDSRAWVDGLQDFRDEENMGQHRRAVGGGRRNLRRTATVAALSSALTVAVAYPAVAAAPDGGDALVAGTPCTASARACVDIGSHSAWLISDGQVVRGPVDMTDGAEGFETPRGTFQVEWKHVDHVSGEYGTPMPYSVFFAPGGIAFHEGDLGTSSAGCIRLAHDDAAAFFDFLQVGDEVQVR
jgi:hypothetical protein